MLLKWAVYFLLMTINENLKKVLKFPKFNGKTTKKNKLSSEIFQSEYAQARRAKILVAPGATRGTYKL